MTSRFIAPVLALGALASAQTAQAQQSCVAPADLSDTIIYAMPIAYDASLQACTKQFSMDGYMQNGGADFVEQFRAQQDAAWPGMFRLIKVFMSEGGKAKSKSADMSAMLSALPEDAIRPFIDAIVAQKIAEEIKPQSCETIERTAELLSPLPADNIAQLVTLLASQADLKEPEICGTKAAKAATQTKETKSQ